MSPLFVLALLLSTAAVATVAYLCGRAAGRIDAEIERGRLPEPKPCAECGHDRNRHVSGLEGECLDCACWGWVGKA